MCGIAALCGDVGLPPADRSAALGRMLAAMHHRGPDERGQCLVGPVGLGNVRLSIVDLAHGQQPMVSEDGSLHVVFNGEIFNFPELREMLEGRGRRFRTRCDTEVLLHLYAEFGPEGVHHLNGQFAFVLWDEQRQRLFGARDRLGIRPCFTHEGPGRLLVASTVAALFATGLVPRAIDPGELRHVFTTWGPLPGHTVFAGIREIRPGHAFTWSPETGLRTWQYWDLVFPTREELDGRASEPLPVLLERFQELLLDAVRIQLRADVPVGAYVSGGLDSAVTASLIRRVHSRELRTFSIGFADPEFDERPFQELMIQQLGSTHHVVTPSLTELAAAFPEAVRHAEAPLLRTAPTPMAILARLVREQGFKVVLTGEGADEFLLGYNIFKEAKVRRFWARQPDSPARAALLTRIYPYLGDARNRAGAFWRQFFAQGLTQTDDPFFSHRIRWTEGASLTRFLHPEACRGEWSGEAELAAMLPAHFARWHPMGQAQYLEAKLFLPNYLLCSQGDRMMLAHSVEGRFPFLDHRLVEYLNTVPPERKMPGLREKTLLKKAFAGRLPAPIVDRPKQPYRAPSIAEAILRERGGLFEEYLAPTALRQADLLDPEAVGLLLTKLSRPGRGFTGNRDTMAFLAILSTQILWRRLVATG